MWPAQRAPRPFVRHIRRDRSPIRGVVFSRDWRTLASASGNAVRIRDVATGMRRGGALRHPHRVNDVAMTADGRTIASASGTTVRVWDLATAEHPRRTLVLGHHVTAVAIGPQGTLAAASGTDVRLWDLKTLKSLRTHRHEGRVTTLAITDRMLASADDGASANEQPRIRLWDLRTRKELHPPLTGHTASIRSIAFAADDRTLASTDDDGTVRLWDLERRQQLGPPLPGGDPNIPETFDEVDPHRTTVSFDRDGTTLAVADGRGTVRMWDVKTYTRLGLPIVGRLRSARPTVAFSPDGLSLATSAGDRAIAIRDGLFWRDLPALRTEVCRLAGPGLSQSEWSRFVRNIPYRRSCP